MSTERINVEQPEELNIDALQELIILNSMQVAGQTEARRIDAQITVVEVNPNLIISTGSKGQSRPNQDRAGVTFDASGSLWFTVADGVGGGALGDLAASLAVRTAIDYISKGIADTESLLALTATQLSESTIKMHHLAKFLMDHKELYANVFKKWVRGITDPRRAPQTMLTIAKMSPTGLLSIRSAADGYVIIRRLDNSVITLTLQHDGPEGAWNHSRLILGNECPDFSVNTQPNMQLADGDIVVITTDGISPAEGRTLSSLFQLQCSIEDIAHELLHSSIQDDKTAVCFRYVAPSA